MSATPPYRADAHRQRERRASGRTDIEAIDGKAFAALGTGRQIAPYSKACPSLGLKEAYQVTVAVRAKREARGERSIGRKIGFTNRTI